MSARASIAAIAVLSLCVFVVHEDRAREQGLLGQVFSPTEAYAPVDLHPAALPALKAKPAELPVVAQAAPVAVPQMAPVEAFAAAPELASAGPDELVALAAPAAPALEAPAGPSPFEAPQLARINVLDAADRERRAKLEAQFQAPTAPASRDNEARCLDACSRPGVFGKPYHAAINSASPNIDLRYKRLPCSKPGAFRYEVSNRGRHRYTGVVLYDGDQRWDVGELAPGRAVVIGTAKPLGPNPGVDHDPVFTSVWDP